MSVKRMRTIKPTHYITDKKGNKIAVFRGGIKDTNKYARKTDRQLKDEANENNREYKPD